MMSDFQVVTEPADDDYEVAFGQEAPPERDFAKELADKEAELETQRKAREELEARQKMSGGLDTISELVKKQQEAEQRREAEAREKAAQSAQQFGISPDDPEYAEMEKLFLESPAKAFAKWTKMVQDRLVMPVGQYLAGQVEAVDRLVKARRGVGVRPKGQAQTLQDLDHLAFWNPGRAVEGHVLHEVGDPLLAVRLVQGSR
jgi:enolase